TEVMRAGNVLRGFDEDMRAGLRDELTRAGVKLQFGSLPSRICWFLNTSALQSIAPVRPLHKVNHVQSRRQS
ncbi:MAG: hypothetical protein ACHP7O_12305, partial [Burkholderiales bacterium]